MAKLFNFFKNEACILLRRYTEIASVSTNTQMATKGTLAAAEFTDGIDCGIEFNFRDGRIDRSADEKEFTCAFVKEVLRWGNQKIAGL
jgi:hypothetical protein